MHKYKKDLSTHHSNIHIRTHELHDWIKCGANDSVIDVMRAGPKNLMAIAYYMHTPTDIIQDKHTV